MARKMPVQYPGAIYYVMNRGDHREFIFLVEGDRLLFLWYFGGSVSKDDLADLQGGLDCGTVGYGQ
jgi:hypothetical protein